MASVTGGDQTLCNVTTANITGNTPTVGTGQWVKVSGPGTITNVNAATTTVTGINSTIPTVVRWLITSGACTSQEDITITVSPNPTVASVTGGDQTLCNVTTANITGNTPTVGTGQWVKVSGPGGITNVNAATTTVTGLNSTTPTVVKWVITSGACNSEDQITITVSPTPTTAAITGGDQTLCNVTTANITGNTPTVGTGQWVKVSGPGTITNVNVVSTTVTGLNSTTPTVVRWEITSGACTSQDDINITVSPTPTTASVTGGDQTLCNVTTANISGNTPTVGTGAWVKVSGPGGITNVNAATTTVTGLNTTTPTVVKWVITSGACNSEDQITITVNEAATIAAAGADQNLCNVTTATLAANNPTVGTGAWQIVSGPGTIAGADLNNPNAPITGLSTTTSTVARWVITNGSCNSQDEVTITVSPAPTTAAVTGGDQTLCNVTSTTITGNTPAVGTGAWVKVSGPGTITNVNSTTTTVTGLTTTTPTFVKWTISNGSCTASENQISITVDAAPTVSNAGTNQTLCNATTATMAANNPTVGTGAWVKVSGPGTIAAAEVNNPTAQITGLTAGSTTRYQWVISNGVCTNSSSTVDIIVDALPTVAAVTGGNQDLCNVTTTNITGNTPTVGTGQWVKVSGPGTITNVNAATTTVTGLTSTTPTVVKWVISNGSCTDSESQISINVNATPTVANAGGNQTLCNVTTANISGNPPTVGTGQWVKVSGPGTIANVNAASTTVNGLNTTTPTVVKWVISNGTCTDSEDQITLTVSPTPTVANAGSDQTLCNVTTATLAANNPTVGTGTWQIVSGPGSIAGADLNNPNAPITGLSTTTPTVARWVITSGSCTSQDEVTITVSPTPTTAAVTGGDQTLCNVTTTTITGNTPTVGTGAWVKVSGPGTITNVNAASTTVTGLTSTTQTVVRWEITSGACNSQDDINITVSPTPTTASVTGGDQTLCNVTTANITGNTPTIGTGQWVKVSGPGTITNVNVVSTTVTGLNSTTPTVVRWEITSGACTSQDDINITVSPTPTTASVTGGDQTLCNVTTTNISGNTPTVGTGQWVKVSGPGGITNVNAATTTVTGLNTTTPTVVKWVITSGACNSEDQITITVNEAATIAAAGADQNLCNVTTATLAANNPTVGTGAWQIVSGPGTISGAQLNNPNAPITGLSTTTPTVARWVITNGSCNSQDEVTITVSPAPTTAAVTGGDQTLCNVTSTTITGNTPTVGTGAWVKVSGPGTITNVNSTTTTVTGLNSTNPTVVRWVITSGVCSSQDQMTITVNAAPTVANAGVDQSLCNVTTATLSANTPTVGTGTWTVVSGPGTIAGAQLNNPNAPITGLNSTTPTVVRWVVSTGAGCSSQDDATISVDALPTAAAVTGGNQDLCNVTTTNITGNTPTVGTGIWVKVSGPGTITNVNAASTTVTGLTSTTPTVVKWVISNGSCTDSESQISINVNATPTVANAGGNQTLCNVTTANISGNTPTVGTGQWVKVSGPGTIANVNAASTTVNGLNSTTPTVVKWVISNGTCTDSEDQITLTIEALPTVANAGSDQTLCNVTTASITGNAPAVGTGAWVKVSGPGTITNVNAASTTVTGLTSTTPTVVKWVISNGSCTDSEDQISLSVDALPTVASVTGGDQTLCNVTTANISGNTPTVGTGAWVKVSGPGAIANVNLASTSVTGLNSTTPTVVKWVISNGTCTDSEDQITITVNEAATIAAAGADQNLCNVTTATLAANNPTVGTGAWQIVSGPGTIAGADLNNPNAPITGLSTTTPTVARWVITNGSCNSQDEVTITVSPAPTTAAVTGGDQTLCNVTSTTITGNTPAVGTGAWVKVSGPGTITNVNSATTTVTGLTTTTPTFVKWTISNGSCAASENQISITVDAAPTVSNAGTNQTLCNVTTATMAANTPAVGTGAWVKVSGPGTIAAAEVNNPTAQITGLTAGSTTRYQWVISNGVCTNSSSTVDIIVDALPTVAAVTGGNQDLCNVTTTNITGNTPTVGTGIWVKVSGPGTITNVNAATTTVTGLTSTTPTVVKWVISNGSCTDSESQISINVNATPTVANAGGNQTLCNVTTANISGNTPTVGTGQWVKVSGPGTIANVNAASTTVNGLNTTTPTVVKWVISNGTCTDSEDQITLTIEALPTVADAGSDQTLCNVTTASITGNAPAVGTGAWVKVSGPGTITNVNAASTTVTGLNSTTPTLVKWVISNGSCTDSEDQISLSVDALPTVASVTGGDQTLCNVTTANISGNTPTVGTGAWVKVSGPGTIANVNAASTTVNGLNSTTPTVVKWVISNGTCTDSEDQITITVNEAATIAAAGADQNLCNVTTATLAANNPTVGTGAWQIVSGPGTIAGADLNNPNAPITGLSTTTPTVARWVITNGSCNSQDEVTITVSPAPTTAAVTGGDQTLCNVTSTTITGNTPTVGTGAWVKVSGPGTITNVNSATTTVTGLTTTTPTFVKWTISNGSCTASENQISITVDAAPTVSNAGTNQTLCNVTTATMAANTPAVGTGAWVKVSGPGTIAAAEVNNPTAQITGLTAGSTTRYQWVISNGVCTNSSSTVDIIVDALPTAANAGTDQTLCGVTTANLSANAPTVGTGTWSVVSGPGTIAAPQLNNPNATVTGLSTTTPTILKWMVTNSTCNSEDQVTITVDATPTVANAGGNQQLCGVNTTTTTNLAANAPTVGTGTWTVVSGSGSFGNANVPTTTVSGLSYGANVFRWTISNGATCTPSMADVTITLFQPPTTANAGLNQSLCGPNTTTTANLAANTPTVGTGAWTVVSGTGSFSNVNAANATVSGLSYGANVFRWTVTNGTCAPSASDVTITLFEPPSTANAGSNQSLCGLNTTTTATLNATNPAVGTGTWTIVSGTGSFSNVNAANATVSGLSYGANVFRWTVTNGNCTPTVADITVTLFEPPSTANAGVSQTLCGVNTSTTASITANTPTAGSGTWTVISGSGVFANANTPNTTISGLSYGANVFRWTISNGSCPTSSSDVTITLNQPPTNANAGADQVLCGLTGATSTSLAANNPTVGTGTWTVVSGTGSFSNANASNATVSGLSYGTNVFRWTISNGNCTPSVSDMTVTLNQPPTTANAGGAQTVCATTATLNANTPAVGTGMWTLISGSGAVTNATSPITTVTNLGVGINTFQWTISNGNCTNSTATVTITREATPTTANAGADQRVCGTSVTLNGNNPSAGTGQWTLISGSGTISNAASPNTTVSNLGIGVNVFKWTISNGSCPVSESNVNITRDAPPTTSIAGGNQTTCATTVNLTGNTPTTGTGQWSIVSGSGVITDPGNPNTQVSNLGVGLNIFRWTITNTCSSSSSSISVTKEATPSTANAGSNQVVCVNTATLTATSPTVGTGNWTTVAGTGTVTNPTSPNSGVTGLSVGVNTFQWTVSNGSCTPSVASVSIVRDQEPTIASAGPDQTLCGATTATFAANSPTVGTGRWTQVSGPGTANIINPGANVSGITGLVAGSYTFRWTITNGSCTASTDDMVMNVIAAPVTTVNLQVSDATFCIDQRPAVFNITVSNTEAGTTYELRNGATVLTSQVSAGGTLTFSNLPTPTASATYDVYATPAAVGGASCPSEKLADRAQITIDNCNTPVANNLTLKTDNCTDINLNLLPDSTNQAQGGVTFAVTEARDFVTPTGGIVNMSANGTFKYEPRTAFIGRDSVSYQVCNSNGSCADGKIYISIEACTNDAPEAKDDVYTIDNCKVLTGNVLLNDVDANTNTLKISMVGSLLTNRRGVVILEADGGFTYTPPEDFVGIDTLAYQVCDDASISKCDSALLIVNVTECGQIFIPNGFSPNDDGKNDTYVILGVEKYQVTFSVYNRWGSRVYFNKDYKNDWNGFANQGNLSGQRLPDGTYYYVIDLNNGQKPSAAYLILQR
ncbi:gliding motility-associated C-terminal domain-containing protein [uncultured Microscilla sp.]|uniref:T9SS type B sorting domain-containing protein n=1 Tax=uncultured Microscilla sp. TaxID=432653 RepID=UPI00262282F8|nr:gliding motility-associated C-terminal domain-containing protein [uncultured Microscilla sp.]